MHNAQFLEHNSLMPNHITAQMLTEYYPYILTMVLATCTVQVSPQMHTYMCAITSVCV